MKSRGTTSRGSTFFPRRPVVLMDPATASTIPPSPVHPEALQDFGRNGARGRSLRAQLASRFPGRAEQEIEDAVQTACRCFLGEAEGITDPGQVYAWLRTTAHHALIRELDRRDREVAIDPNELVHDEKLLEETEPADELIALEDEEDLEILVRDVAAALSERRQEILALWAAGHKRPEIAARLGLRERAVKRDLMAILEQARVALAGEAGGGCLQGEPMVLRLAYGLASAAEANQARLHLDRCRRCEQLKLRLETWREKAGALLPVPAAEAASPGVFEQLAHRGADALGSLKQQVAGGGAQVKQQATLSAYSRAADPTPIAGVRPGAVIAVVAGCIAVGGGATYCVEQGVDPFGAATGLIAGSGDGGEPEPAPPTEVTEPADVTPPPVTYEPQPSEPEPAVPPTVEPKPEPRPEPEPEPEPAPPPPEANFEPSAPVAPTSAGEMSAPAVESAPPVTPKPAPVPSDSPPQFGGP